MGVEETTNMSSILCSVRKALDADSYFDDQLILYINTVFATLAQDGVGPSGGFKITGEEETWDEYLEGLYDPENVYSIIQTYVALSVKIVFDTPTGSVLGAMQEIIKEYKWRLQEEFDRGKKHEQ